MSGARRPRSSRCGRSFHLKCGSHAAKHVNYSLWPDFTHGRCSTMCVEALMKTYRWLTLVAAALLTVFAPVNFAAAGSPASAASPSPCAMRLSVELTPDVPNPRDLGFLSSLLSNHPDYQLTLEHEHDGSVIVLDLAGPGPEYQCQNVIET